jgi:hypothetical protein
MTHEYIESRASRLAAREPFIHNLYVVYTAVLCSPENGGSMFRRNAGISLQVLTAQQPTIPTSLLLGILLCRLLVRGLV